MDIGKRKAQDKNFKPVKNKTVVNNITKLMKTKKSNLQALTCQNRANKFQIFT